MVDRTLEKKVFEIVSEVTGKDPADFSLSTTLVAGLGIDSAAGLLLLVELEDAFGLTISDADAARMVTVGDVVASVGSRSG